MQKHDAIKEMMLLSGGTIASLTGLRSYTDCDQLRERWIDQIEEIDVTGCNTWVDVWNILKVNQSVAYTVAKD